MLLAAASSMKHFKILLFLATAQLMGCTYYRYPEKTTRYFPAFPHFSEVQVVEKDSMPVEPYVELADLKQIESEENKYALLKEKAIAIGADALLIQGKEDIEWTESDYGLVDLIADLAFDGDFEATYYHYEADVIVAKGIKYVKNINYLDQLVKQKEIVQLQPVYTGDPICIISYHPLGYPSNIDGDLFPYSILEEFSLDRLILEENSSWSYRWKNDSTLIRKMPNQRVEVTFHEKQPVEVMYKKTVGDHMEKYLISSIFSYEGQIEHVYSRAKKGGFEMLQHFEYDQKNRISRQIVKLPDRKLKYEVKYQYFSNDDLDSLVTIHDGELITEIPQSKLND